MTPPVTAGAENGGELGCRAKLLQDQGEDRLVDPGHPDPMSSQIPKKIRLEVLRDPKTHGILYEFGPVASPACVGSQHNDPTDPIHDPERRHETAVSRWAPPCPVSEAAILDHHGSSHSSSWVDTTLMTQQKSERKNKSYYDP